MKRSIHLIGLLTLLLAMTIFLCAYTQECEMFTDPKAFPDQEEQQKEGANQEQIKENSKNAEEPKQEYNPESESPESLEASAPTTFIGTEMPKNWPEDVPIKSGIEIKSTQEQGSGAGYVAGIAGTYFGDPMGLYDFYKNTLSSYNLTETKAKANDGSESITLLGEKDGAEVTVVIQYKGDEVILVAIGYKIK